MKSRLARVIVSAAAVALVAACSSANLMYSNIAFAYSNAAPMLAWAVDDYVDLNDGQKDWVRERLNRLISWHRSRELPEYRRLLTSLEANLQGGLSVDEVRAAHRQMRAHYQRMVGQVVPEAADLLLQLDGEQVEALERKFADDNRKVVKDSGREGDERRSRSIRKAIEHLEAWTGALDASQRELIASRMRASPDLSAERMADRRYRQAHTLALVRAKPDRDATIAELRRLLIDTESWRRPEYQRRLLERDERNFEMIATLSSTLTPEQQANVHRRVRGLVADITNLTAAGVKPAS